MSSRTYTVSELLRLRSSQSSQTLCNMVKANPELGNIITKQNNTSQSRRLKKVKDDAMSSADSDDYIVFQGKRQSRLPINNLDGETQWNYCGRDGSEHNHTEPIAAPTGLDAQQNEGFQRFFKAVVSPTHVRVTAGGRIVPNTRSTTSPTAKWDKDRVDTESESADLSKKSAFENVTDRASSAQRPSSAVPPMGLPPMAHPIYAGYPPIFTPFGTPISFYPMTNGVPMPYGFPQAQISAASAARDPATNGNKQVEENIKGFRAQSAQEGDKKAKPAPIKISPPEQFDQGRPYFFNGNVFYPGGPLPMQSQATPMTPSPYFGGFPVHPAIARTGSLGQPSPIFPMPSPHMLSSPSFAPPLSAGASNSPQQLPKPAQADAAPHSSSTKPPITSIKPSQITQNQLSALRSQLKYYEDQLQYNKHQIDEKATQAQIQTIRKLIGQFEHNYHMQMSFEKAIYPNAEKKVAAMGTEAHHCETPTKPSTKEDISEEASQTGSMRSVQRTYPTLNHAQSMDQIRHKTVKDLRQRAGINSSKGMDTTSALSALEAHLTRGHEHNSVKKTSLSTRAAMAPIFEPRGNTPCLSSVETNNLNSLIDADQCSDSHWERSASLQSTQQGLWTGISSLSGFLPDNQDATTERGITGSSLTTPYLVGHLPHDLGVSSAYSGDYIYSRELTTEEKRARHVYWGGVSVKGSGLPKFDGKDFYPPSPAKPSEKIDTTLKAIPEPISIGKPVSDYDFESTKTTEDPFHTTHRIENTRGTQSTRKLSHAVPIINPETMTREDVEIRPKTTKSTEPQPQTSVGSQDVGKGLCEKLRCSPTKTPTILKASLASRRTLERSSKGSSNDLWQSMMKKASTSGAVTASSVSSTTANGLLPQLSGHAMASLSPAIAKANGALRALSSGKENTEALGKYSHFEQTGENRPPTDLSMTQEDIIADLHQRMLRDAERRGVIGPDWQ